MPITTIRARSLPYRPAQSATRRVCTRCGIGFKNHQATKYGTYTECRDCRGMN